MSSFGVNPNGFSLKRLADIRADLKQRLETIQDPDSGEFLQVDFDEDDPLINVINAFADSIANVHELAQTVYNQFDPRNATNEALSALVQLNAITRRLATSTVINITVTGSPGAILPAGQRISNSNQAAVFATDAELTIGGGGSTTGTASAEETGPTTVANGSVTSILTPVPGWSSVTNDSTSSTGRNRETDVELRQRRSQSIGATGLTNVESIRAGLLNLQGVTFVRVYQNNTLSTDARGIPGKSIGVVILGGDNDEIARQLFLRTPAGVGYHGSTVVVLEDSQGEEYSIQFQRPTEDNIFIQVDITITDSSKYPTNGDTTIKERIVAYSQGGAPAIGVIDNFDDTGFQPGEDIILSRLYTPINSVPGHRVTNLQIGLSAGSLGTADIPIDFDHIGLFDVANITVNVTS